MLLCRCSWGASPSKSLTPKLVGFFSEMPPIGCTLLTPHVTLEPPDNHLAICALLVCLSAIHLVECHVCLTFLSQHIFDYIFCLPTMPECCCARQSAGMEQPSFCPGGGGVEKNFAPRKNFRTPSPLQGLAAKKHCRTRTVAFGNFFSWTTNCTSLVVVAPNYTMYLDHLFAHCM